MSATTLQPMFDVEELLAGSGPRARATDKLTSHIAADASQLHLHEAKHRILELVAVHQPIVGTELNELYRLASARMNWRRLAFDSPRKRAGELAVDGFLDDSETRIADGNYLPESVYRITAKGLEALGARA